MVIKSFWDNLNTSKFEFQTNDRYVVPSKELFSMIFVMGVNILFKIIY